MTLKEACKNALTILKQVMEEKLNSTNVEVRTGPKVMNFFRNQQLSMKLIIFINVLLAFSHLLAL